MKARIGSRGNLAKGAGIRFELTDPAISKRARKKDDTNDARKKGFAVEFEREVYAYENRCPHLGVELDWAPGVFFNETQEFLVCSTHGAYFKPDTGECISGPCAGQYLCALEIHEEHGDLFIRSD